MVQEIYKAKERVWLLETNSNHLGYNLLAIYQLGLWMDTLINLKCSIIDRYVAYYDITINETT